MFIIKFVFKFCIYCKESDIADRGERIGVKFRC